MKGEEKDKHWRKKGHGRGRRGRGEREEVEKNMRKGDSREGIKERRERKR